MFRTVVEWYLQRITGGLLLMLLAAHFWIEHFATANVRRGELTYAAVAARLSNPAWQAIDVAFLLVALYHGLNGLRNIVLDYGVGARAGRAVTVLLMLIGVMWAYWGIDAFRRL